MLSVLSLKCTKIDNSKKLKEFVVNGMQMIISCHFFIGCFSKMCHRVHLNRLLCFRLFNRSAVNCFVYLVIEQL